MKNLITTFVLFVFTFTMVNAQIKKPVLKKNNVKVHKVNTGVKIKNIDKLSSTDLKKLRIPTVSITDAQRNAKAISSWEITPLRPKYSSLELVRHFGEYSLQGWTLEPRPRFEGPEFKGFDLSAIHLKFRATGGTRYLIRVKLKDVARELV